MHWVLDDKIQFIVMENCTLSELVIKDALIGEIISKSAFKFLEQKIGWNINSYYMRWWLVETGNAYHF